MKFYVLTLTATRVNNKENIYSFVDMFGSMENLASETIGLFTNKSKALKCFYAYYEKENENNGENTMIKIYQRGDKIEGRIVTKQIDECENEWVTMVHLKCIEATDDLDIYEEVCRNYI